MKPWPPTPVKTLLVDLDGTLLASRDLGLRAEFIVRVLCRVSRVAGPRVAWRALRATAKALERPARPAGGDGPVLTNSRRAGDAFARELRLSGEDGDRLVQDVIGAVFPKLARHFYPVPGAVQFLEWAKPRYRLVLATNPVWPLAQVELRLAWAGIDPGMFSAITHAGRMSACKPSAEYYSEVLAQEGLEAGECLLIGDDPRKDLPAVRVGIPVYLLSDREQELLVEGAAATGRSGSYDRLRSLLRAAEAGAT